MRLLERFSSALNRILMFVAGGCLAVMVALTCANIVLRFFRLPISGTFELMGFLGAVTVAFALGYTQRAGGHIAVDVLVHTYPARMRCLVQFLNSLVCAAFFGLVTWQTAAWATTLVRTGEVTETLRIIYYPFTYAVALGCGTLGLVCLCEALRHAAAAMKGAA